MPDPVEQLKEGAVLSTYKLSVVCGLCVVPELTGQRETQDSPRGPGLYSQCTRT